MSEWIPRRFWTKAEVTTAPEGYGIALDGRALRTPAKAQMILPSRPLAEAVAAEWRAQEEKIDPLSMPFTRTVNSAIDNVAKNHSQIAEMIAAYGESDLLCYRAESPAELVARQAAAWDPLLDWAAGEFGAPLEIGAGLIHVAQPESSLKILAQKVHDLDAFRMAAFHDLVALSGSLIIGFAVLDKFLPADTLWERSRLDEIWQQEHWGEDEDAAHIIARKREEFFHAVAVVEKLAE
ncbi:MAG: ATPase [Mangrovicoccus sp.]|nr:ATPase [Mangrovicoccus sp.]